MIPQLSIQERDRRYKIVRGEMAKRGIDCLLLPANTGRWEQLQGDSRYLTTIGGFATEVFTVFPRDGDVTAGLVDAMEWLAVNVPIYAINVLLSTATDMWALRYPEPNELYVLDRRQARPDDEFHLRTNRIRAYCAHLRDRPSVVFASEPMDDNPGWRLIGPGELVHVDAALQLTRKLVLPDLPKHKLRRQDLSPTVDAAQHTRRH